MGKALEAWEFLVPPDLDGSKAKLSGS